MSWQTQNEIAAGVRMRLRLLNKTQSLQERHNSYPFLVDLKFLKDPTEEFRISHSKGISCLHANEINKGKVSAEPDTNFNGPRRPSESDFLTVGEWIAREDQCRYKLETLLRIRKLEGKK
ncbi:hypothetical protein TNCV_2284081 [Trichonephila clavipes]|nr:hypothetical protein TNCV_2284081 [Trichonephila clavipes]